MDDLLVDEDAPPIAGVGEAQSKRNHLEPVSASENSGSKGARKVRSRREFGDPRDKVAVENSQVECFRVIVLYSSRS
jgi:hypothetical protein